MRHAVSANWSTGAAWVLLTTVVMLALSARPASAQGGEGLTPSFGDGRLTLTGDGFRPGERITVSVRVGDARPQFMVTADARGRFRLTTGLAVPPGSSLQIEARGEQGTTQAVITSVPGGIPARPDAGAAPPAPVVPEAETGWLVVGGLAVLGAFLVVRSSRQHRA